MAGELRCGNCPAAKRLERAGVVQFDCVLSLAYHVKPADHMCDMKIDLMRRVVMAHDMARCAPKGLGGEAGC